MTGKRLSGWDMEDSAWDAGNAIIRSAHLERRHKVRPSRVTLEQAQELFKTCMPVRKKEEKRSADVWDRFWQSGICGSDTAAISKIRNGWIRIEKRDVCRADMQNPVTLEVTGCVYAGQETALVLKPYQAVRIMTGAMIPEGADCVVKQEDTDWNAEAVRIYHNAQPGENYCPKGEDFSVGDLLAEAGTPVDSYLLAAVTAAGVSNLTVYKRLKAAVITTGDELQNTEIALRPGKIYDANGVWLCSRLREMDCEVVRYQTAGDDQSKIADEIREAWKEADLILTTGGVSVGEKDLLPGVIENLNGNVLFHGIQVKPGMPTMLSVVKGTPVLSLSGNPFAVEAFI